VLAPLAEIAPSLTDPRGGLTALKRLDGLPSTPVVKEVGSLEVAGILASTSRK